MRAWFPGVFGWSAGVVYVSYDTCLLGFTAWQTFRLTRAAAPPPLVGRGVTLGVIVAAHNEAAVLPVTLAALMRQTDRAETVMIADDGSSDATAAALATFGLAAPPLGEAAASTHHSRAVLAASAARRQGGRIECSDPASSDGHRDDG